METYCLSEVKETINNQGDLRDEGLAPRIFYPKYGATQLSCSRKKALTPWIAARRRIRSCSVCGGNQTAERASFIEYLEK
jgi:hypothetical protein